MKILAIDPSLTNTAVVYGDESGYVVKCFSALSSGDAVLDRMRRYSRLVSDISVWIDALPGYVEGVFIEGYSFGSQGAAVTKIAEYGGLLREMLWRQLETQRIYEVAPTTLKKFCTGKGAGKKEMVIAHLMKRYDIEFSTNDEFDAYGLYRLGLVAEGLCEAANQAQQEAVDTVLGRTVKKPKKRKAVQ